METDIDDGVNINNNYSYPHWCNDYIYRMNDNINIINGKNHIKVKNKTISDNIYKCYKFTNKVDKPKLDKIELDKKFDYVTKVKQFRFYPTDKQIIILNKWFNECTNVYNKCVEYNNDDDTWFNMGHKKAKLDIFDILYGDDTKPCPYDILTDEVRIFCSNRKSCLTNKSNGNIRHFELGNKNTFKSQCLFIPKTAINKKEINGEMKGFIYKSHLGSLEGLENIPDKIERDCRILFDKIKKRYTLIVPVNIKKKKIKNIREEVVGIDPGEKIFLSYHSPNRFGHLGYNIRERILETEKKIRIFQRILSRCINRNKKKVNRNKIKKRIIKLYFRINNRVKDLHNKSALFLCKNFKRILIPVFQTQKMVRNEKYDLKGELNAINNIEGYDKMKNRLRSVTKKRRLNGRVKFVLNMLSHYKFRQHLINKANEYGCQIKVVTEEYTSKTCTKCLKISEKYNKRQKECDHCGYKIDRDVNGARNILLMNMKI